MVTFIKLKMINMVRKKKHKIPCLQAFWGEVCLIGVETEETAPNRHTPDDPGVCPNYGGPLRYIGRVSRCSAIESPPQNQRGPPCKQE